MVDKEAENKLLAVIRSTYPNFEGGNCTVIQSSHSDILEVENSTETLIFKFPHRNKHKLVTEANLLEFLGCKLAVEIPQLTHKSADGNFIGYKKISGVVPKTEYFNAMPINCKNKLLRDLTDFLVELHSLVSVDAAKSLGVIQDPSEVYISNLENNFSAFSDAEKPVVDKLIRDKDLFPKDVSLNQFVYNDLHFENIVLDKNNNLVGVIDFGFTAIGDIHREFHHLHNRCPDLVQNFITNYEGKTNKKICPKRVEWLSKVDFMNYQIRSLLQK